MVYSTGGKGDFSRSGAGYKITCLECPKVQIKAEYEGETARNPYSRGIDHQRGLEYMCEKSLLWKHSSIQHGGRIVQFKMDALRAYKYPMMRQVNEGARLRLSGADICIKLKSEFYQPGIVKGIAMRSNVNDEQSGVFPRDGVPGGRGRSCSRGGQQGSRGRGTRPSGQRC